MNNGTQYEIDVLNECPVCGGSEFNALSTPGRWIGVNVFSELKGSIKLVRCRGCQLIFINPRP